MKQSLKYGLLVLLALLLYSVTMKAVEVNSASVSLKKEACFVSQAQTLSHSLNRLAFYCATMPCEMGHVDMSHIPTDKSVIRHYTRFREHKATNDSFSDYLSHSSIYSFSDPVSYYVFGSRKIII